MVDVAVAIALLDHDGVVVPVVTLPNDVTVAIPIGIAMAGSDGHADRTDAHSYFFRTSRHRKRYSGYRYGSY
jgi:hypothetical protein